MKTTGWIATVVSASVLVGATAYALTPSSDNRGEVIHVVDGDTVDIEIAGEETRVRLLNVNTPETVDPNKPVECMGPEASDYLSELLKPGQKVDLEYDQERLDRYGRTLAGVFVDGSLINSEIAAAGLGVAVKYEPNVRFYDEVLEAQNQAENSSVGLFSTSVECTIPAQLEAADQALDQIPTRTTDSIDEASSLASEAAAAAAVGLGVKKAFADIDVNTHPVTYALLAGKFAKAQDQLDAKIKEAKDSEKSYNELHTKLVDEKKERERKAAEAKAKKEAEAKRKAEAEAALRAQEARRKAQQPAPKPRTYAPQPKKRYTAPAPKPKSGSNYSGYTGPRCYAPGGKSWRPCG